MVDFPSGWLLRCRSSTWSGGGSALHENPGFLRASASAGAPAEADRAESERAGSDVGIGETERARVPFEAPARQSASGLPTPGLLGTGAVVRILGVSRRQLQYWAETGLVAPSARTRGGHRRYTFADLVALKAAKQLIDAGVSVQRIRSSLGALKRILPQVRQPLSELVLVATGDVVLVLREGAAFEALSGQEWILEVARFQREVEHLLGARERSRPRRSTGAAARSPGETRSA